MAYVLTNGKYFIRLTDTGATAKTDNINDARVFLTTEKAKERLQKSPGKTKGYYILDVDTKQKYHHSNGRIKFPKEVRKMLYLNADGRCVLCGNKIMYDEATLDHITPLSMGGIDDISNIQVTCKLCNQFKGSIIPSDFFERITEIFMYQMEIKNKNRLYWRIMHTLLLKMV